MARDNKRVFLIVMDSFGIGEMADAADYGDYNVNTLARVGTSSLFSASNLGKLGLFHIDGVAGTPVAGKNGTAAQNDSGAAVQYDHDMTAQNDPDAAAWSDSTAAAQCQMDAGPIGVYGRMKEASKGKDTTIGHWEIAGMISEQPLPTFPNGFPAEVLEEFSKQTGRGVLCNKPYSGTDVIRDYGEQHMKTGDLIVYTSADSVFQIAAHEDVVAVEQLYEYCRTARKILQGPYGVGRVIARPFIGNNKEDFKRTAKRHDFSLEPPRTTMLDQLKDNGFDVISIGKIYDIFAGKGITDFEYTTGNEQGIERTLARMQEDFCGLCFTNLVDYDMLYGHRRDIDGYAKAVAYFDEKLPQLLANLREGDLLMITADHGCDPGYTKTTDHTREHTPLLIYGPGILPRNLGTRETFADIGATILHYFDIQPEIAGENLL